MDIKLLIMDVDGTLTDGNIYMGNDGEFCKAFNIKDGYGIHDILIPAGIKPVIITGRHSKIVENRCKELGITECHQGVSNKNDKLHEIVEQTSTSLSACAYIGDDLNDMLCMKLLHEAGGLVGCPADAAAAVKEIADFVSTYCGGAGAVRDFIEFIVSQ